MKKNNTKLIVFDVDGVLLDNKMGGFKDILVLLGKEKEVQRIDEEYQRKKFTGPWGLKELADLYQGFSKDKLKKVAFNYCKQNLMKGARKTLEELKKKSYLVGALSSNPQFVMDVLSEILPLDFCEGTRLEFEGGIAIGRILKKVDRYRKAEILKEKIKQFGIKKKNVTMVGDSLTDLPMIEEAGLFIAFNAKEEVKEKADIIVDRKDLKEILKLI